MIGIYNDSFIQFLEDNLGSETIKIRSNNIICRCPYCEFDEDKNHYHLYISVEAPIFHCFHAGCPKKSGIIPDLVKKLKGIDISDRFIDPNLVNQKKFEVKNKTSKIKFKDLNIPELNEDSFKLKSIYVKKRLGFNIDLKSINGLFFDVNEFIERNQSYVHFDNSIYKLKDYLQSNFIGFTTENKCVVFFRNIDNNSPFKHFKIKLQQSQFMDYYKLNGADFYSNHVVLAEGVFDIWSEYIFNSLDLRNRTKIYASALSPNYLSMMKSIVYNENLYRIDVSILSDRDVSIDYYEKIKKYNNHFINNLTVYYNKGGKDFNSFPLITERFVL